MRKYIPCRIFIFFPHHCMIFLRPSVQIKFQIASIILAQNLLLSFLIIVWPTCYAGGLYQIKVGGGKTLLESDRLSNFSICTPDTTCRLILTFPPSQLLPSLLEKCIKWQEDDKEIFGIAGAMMWSKVCVAMRKCIWCNRTVLNSDKSKLHDVLKVAKPSLKSNRSLGPGCLLNTQCNLDWYINCRFLRNFSCI